MVYPFKLLIYDEHDREGGEEDGWVKFTYGFDLAEKRIIDWQTTAIFDIENNPIPCIIIWLSNGDSVYGRYSYEAFMKIYNGEYKELLTQFMIDKKVWNGELVKETPKLGIWKRLKIWWAGEPPA